MITNEPKIPTSQKTLFPSFPAVLICSARRQPGGRSSATPNKYLVLFVGSCKRNRMKESDHENQHAPLSDYGARRIVWLVFLLVIVWLILRTLQDVILLFALVFLLAMVLNPIVVWFEKRHVPRFVSVILLMLALVAVTATIVVFAIPPLARQTQELDRSSSQVWHGILACSE